MQNQMSDDNNYNDTMEMGRWGDGAGGGKEVGRRWEGGGKGEEN